MVDDDPIRVLWRQLAERGLLHVVLEEAGRFYVTADLILSRTRTKRCSEARRAVAVRLYVDAGLSLPEVGTLLGRDHTSILEMLRVEGVDRRPCPAALKASKAAAVARKRRAA